MLNKKNVKKRWHNFVTAGIFVKKKENLGIYATHAIHGLQQINWEKLWMYLNYQFIALKNFARSGKKSAIISDQAHLGTTISNIALRTRLCYSIDPVSTGDITNILINSNKPNSLINVGMDYPTQFLREARILITPTINYINDINRPSRRGVYYNNPSITNEMCILKQLATIYTTLLDKRESYNKTFVPDLFEKKIENSLRKKLAHFEFKGNIIKKKIRNRIILKNKEKLWLKFAIKNSMHYIYFEPFYLKFRKLQQHLYFYYKIRKIKLKKQRYYQKLKNIHYRKRRILCKNMNDKKFKHLFLSRKLYLLQLYVRMQKRFMLFALQESIIVIEDEFNHTWSKLLSTNNVLIKKNLILTYYEMKHLNNEENQEDA